MVYFKDFGPWVYIMVRNAGLRIRIHFIRVRIRIQHFRLNTDPDTGVLMTKIWKKITAQKEIKFLRIKNYNLPILGPP